MVYELRSQTYLEMDEIHLRKTGRQIAVSEAEGKNTRDPTLDFVQLS